MFHKLTPKLRGLDGLSQGGNGSVQICPPAPIIGTQQAVVRIKAKLRPGTNVGNNYGLWVDGDSNSWTALINGSAASGLSFGALVQAGTTSADRALSVTNQAGTAVFLRIVGDGSGLLGPSATLGLSWDTAGHITAATPASSGHTITSTAIAGSYAGSFAGSATSGQSFGLFVVGGTTSADAAIRVSNSGATANMFEIFGDGHGQLGPTAALGLSWTAAGNETIAAPTSGRALLVNNANAQPAFEVSADAAFTDARSCIRFTALKTSSQQYDFGIDTQGSAAKNFEIRDITTSGSPVRLRLSQGGFFTILDPAAIGTALTVNGSSAATSGAAFIANMGLVNQSFTLNGVASGRAFFDLQVNGANKGYVGVNSAAGDLIPGSALNALCLRSATGLSVSVDAGSTAALIIGANNFTTHNGIVLSTKGNEGFVGAYEYAFHGGL